MDKVLPGQQVQQRASDYNAIVDAAESAKFRGPSAPRIPLKQSSNVVITVRNDADEDFPRYAVVALGDPVTLPDSDIDEFRRRVVFNVDLPDTTQARWVMLLEPLKQGAVGQAAYSGIFPCRINLLWEGHTAVTYKAPSTDLEEDPPAEDELDPRYRLISCDGGDARILWVAGGVGTADDTGEQDAVIQFGESEPAQVWAQLTGQSTTDPTLYSFKQVKREWDGHTYQITQLDSAIEGTLTSNSAVAANGLPTAVALDVYLLTRGFRTSDDGTVEMFWLLDAPEGMWVRVNSSSAISGQANRWAYSCVQVNYVRAGLFQDIPAGITISAYNSLETNNTASGVQGNSVDLSALASTFALKPVTGNPVVFVRPEWTCDTPRVLQWVFEYSNAVQGPCP